MWLVFLGVSGGEGGGGSVTGFVGVSGSLVDCGKILKRSGDGSGVCQYFKPC